jgi:hypothetical protein
MSADRKRSIISGILFLVGFFGMGTVALTKPILDAPDYLTRIAANPDRIIAGALFQFIMAAACAGIAISLYPVLKKYSEGLALGAVSFRIIEATFQIAGVVILLLLVTLSHEAAKPGVPDPSHFLLAGSMLRAGSSWVNDVAALVSWCAGALMYYWIFFRTGLLPRWLASWGLAGATLTILSSMLVMFRVIDPMSSTQVTMNLPIALQELVLAVWLIAKGFDPSALASLSARQT